jgi:hypothetical protein
MNTRLNRRIEALENSLPKPRDLREEIRVRALRTALSLEELEVLRASVGEDGTVPIPPEWRPRVEVALGAAARELTARSFSELQEL